MEDMNLTNMDNAVEMEVPAMDAKTEKNCGGILGLILGAGGVIVLYEGGKWVIKKAVKGVKKVLSKKSKDEPITAEETVEEEIAD